MTTAKDTKEMVELYLDMISKKYNIDAKVKFKRESRLLKIVRPILELFNKNYWDGYITTLGSTMYVPDSWFKDGDVKSRLQTTAHEAIHMIQAKRQTNLVHGFLYLFPQSLAVFSVLSFLAIPFSNAWLWCLLFLLCLAPLPAPFRYQKELEAYRVKILFFKYAYHSSSDLMNWAKKSIVKNLSKSDYYFCWPFPKRIYKDLDNAEKEFDKEIYQDVISFLREHNLLVTE